MLTPSGTLVLQTRVSNQACLAGDARALLPRNKIKEGGSDMPGRDPHGFALIFCYNSIALLLKFTGG